MLYSYKCRVCGYVTEDIRTVEERYSPCTCEYCGGDSEKLVDMPAKTPARWGDSHGYYDRGLGMYVENSMQKEQILKDRGLVHVDEAAMQKQTYALEADLKKTLEHEKSGFGTEQSIERITNVINNLE